MSGLARTQGLAERCLGLSGVLCRAPRVRSNVRSSRPPTSTWSPPSRPTRRVSSEQLADAESQQADLAPEFATLELAEADLAERSPLAVFPRRRFRGPCRARRRRWRRAEARTAAKAIELDREPPRAAERATEKRRNGAWPRSGRERREPAEAELDAVSTSPCQSSSTRAQAVGWPGRRPSGFSRRRKTVPPAPPARPRPRRGPGREPRRAHSTSCREPPVAHALSERAGVLGASRILVEVDPGFESAFEAAVAGPLAPWWSTASSRRGRRRPPALLQLSGTLLPATTGSAGAVIASISRTARPVQHGGLAKCRETARAVALAQGREASSHVLRAFPRWNASSTSCRRRLVTSAGNRLPRWRSTTRSSLSSPQKVIGSRPKDGPSGSPRAV